MTGEIGQLALCLALALAVVQAVAGLWGAREGAGLARSVAFSSATGFFVFIALAFGALMVGFVTSDFSILNVAQNSHTLKPLIYKITGVWGNHEGSMLLWMMVLGVYTVLIAILRLGGDRLAATALGVMGLLAVSFLVFILFTSDPFIRLDPPPFEGNGLNPLLQDPGLAFHPPMLYMGYVGLSATFAYAAAAMIVGNADAAWARASRPFMLVAWIALTLGITGGSWWAYYVLGWGGFWFWDPVENAALMPWLVATALLHSALATERTGAFRTWTLLLSIAAFSLSLIGTFLVRSGVLTSVHAFANDPERGKFILYMIFGSISGALALFAWRAPKLQSGAEFDLVSRETLLVANNLLLCFAVFVVFTGTLYPIIDRRISVGAPYYEMFFAPIFVVLMLLVPFGPRIAWKTGDLKLALHQLAPGLGVAAVAAVCTFAFMAPHSLAAAGAFALAGWVISASVIDVRTRAKLRAVSFSSLASAIAHAGLGVTLIGIAAVAWRSEVVTVLGPGQSIHLAGYALTFKDVGLVNGPNYQAARAIVDVSRGGSFVTTMTPEKRYYPAEGQSISDTAIRTTGFSDLYVAIGDDRGGGRWTVRALFNPLAPFIWLGGGIMALAGMASLLGRLKLRSLLAWRAKTEGTEASRV
ncbi:MAG: heme lyase CcmF/NrfE family subunit [Rhizomicrobium sp.]|jgi:cytochrome c-type biogenesis protein CcmF